MCCGSYGVIGDFPTDNAGQTTLQKAGRSGCGGAGTAGGSVGKVPDNFSSHAGSEGDTLECTVPAAADNTVVAVSAGHMGEGDEVLGKILLKGFLFALTQQETLPRTILFYNGGAFVTCEGSASLEDLRKLESLGVEILTCGTCLNHYGLTEQLRVGGVTNMYVIVEKQMQATKVIRP